MKTFQIISTCTVREVRNVQANSLEEAKAKVLESIGSKPHAIYYLDDFSIDDEDCYEL